MYIFFTYTYLTFKDSLEEKEKWRGGLLINCLKKFYPPLPPPAYVWSFFLQNDKIIYLQVENAFIHG